jgi:hypothetical protein
VAAGEPAGFGVANVRPGVAARVGKTVATTTGVGDAAGRSRRSATEGSRLVLKNTKLTVAMTTKPNSIAVATCHQRSAKPLERPSKGRPHHSHVSAWGELRP